MNVNDIGKKSDDMLSGKERNKFLGVIIGEVIEDFPNITISCFGGDVVLEAHRLLFSPSLLKGYIRKQSQIGELTEDMTALPPGTGGQTGNIVPGPTVPAHQHYMDTYIGEGTYTTKEDSTITYEDYELKLGDNVALFPIDGTNQYWVAGGAISL